LHASTHIGTRSPLQLLLHSFGAMTPQPGHEILFHRNPKSSSLPVVIQNSFRM
jgi:hypothetical protein